MTAEELKSMLMQSTVGFAIVRGRDLVYELANPTYLEMTQRSAEQLIGRRYRDAFPEVAGTGVYELLEGVVDTGRAITFREFHVPLLRGGQLQDCYFDFTASPLRDAESGAITGLVAVASEVTELVVRRREAEALAERLRASEALFRGAQASSLDGFIALRRVRDAAGRVVDFEVLYENEAAARMNGTDPQQLMGQRLLAFFPGLAKHELWPSYVRAAETGEAFRTEASYRGDRMNAWFRVVGCQVGEVLAISFSDISEQKRLEAEEREARRKAEFMAAEIAQQSRDMESALLQLREERNQALAELQKVRSA